MNQSKLKSKSHLKEVIRNHHRLPAKLVSSMLTGLTDVLPKNVLNKMNGSLRRGDLSYLMNYDFNEIELSKKEGVLSVDEFRRLYQLSSFLKKFPSKGSDDLCKEAAFEKLLSGERQCAETNKRLAGDIPLMWREPHYMVKDFILYILGPLPTGFLDTMVKFGPGSTVNDNKRSYAESGAAFKLTDRLLISSRAKLALAAHLSYNQGWISGLGEFYGLNPYDECYDTMFHYEQRIFKHHILVREDVPNKITFVPKNCDEHRTIGVEPNGHVVLQKTLGDLIRRRLRDVGLDLNTQKRNIDLARAAIHANLATIDMKNASNTLSIECVRALLPSDWFMFLNQFRSHNGYCPWNDTTISYEMFSSMGNGFTFELESLIFFAIAITSTMYGLDLSRNEARKLVAVYGDDVIVHEHVNDLCVSLLEFYGFSINVEKSYNDGFFYESCGADYYYGENVRPFFLKREVRTVRDGYFLCNQLMFRIVKYQAYYLWPVYETLFKEICLTVKPLLGPLHLKVDPKWDDDIADDFEAVLRVPLEYAQKHGGCRFSYNGDDPTKPALCAFSYKKAVRIAITVPTKKVFPGRGPIVDYLLVLRGYKEGKSTYKQRSRDRFTRSVTSSWNGTLSPSSITALNVLFSSLP